MPNVETIRQKHVTEHRGNPIASPALLGQRTQRFVAAVREFAERHRVPIVQFKSGERKDDIAKRYFRRFRGREGVVMIGVAQEYDKAFRSKPRRRDRGGPPSFDFYRAKSETRASWPSWPRSATSCRYTTASPTPCSVRSSLPCTTPAPAATPRRA